MAVTVTFRPQFPVAPPAVTAAVPPFAGLADTPTVHSAWKLAVNVWFAWLTTTDRLALVFPSDQPTKMNPVFAVAAIG